MPHIKIQPLKLNNFCTPYYNHIPKSKSDYQNNKEEIDTHSNLVTESKITECNRMSLKVLHRNQCQRFCKMSGQDCTRGLVQSMCQRCLECASHEKDTQIIENNDCDFLISSCDIDFCVKIKAHSVTFCDFWFSNQVAVQVSFFFVMKIITCF